MAQRAKLAPYGEQIIAFEEDDPVPLFLSGQVEHPEKPPGALKKADVSSLIFKASLVGMAAAAIAFAFLSVENPLPVFANAKASLIGASLVQAARPQLVAAAEPVAMAAPTREEIATAFKAARQGQTEIRSSSAIAPQPRHIDADDLAALLKRARGLIEIGDIASARLLLQRAADAQAAEAALLLAQTYDPAVLGSPDARSISADPAAAREWYGKAALFGSTAAQDRLALMQN